MPFQVGDKVILTSYEDDIDDAADDVQKWLREGTVIHITALRNDGGDYPYYINDVSVDVGDACYSAKESELTLYDGKPIPKPKVIKSWLLK